MATSVLNSCSSYSLVLFKFPWGFEFRSSSIFIKRKAARNDSLKRRRKPGKQKNGACSRLRNADRAQYIVRHWYDDEAASSFVFASIAIFAASPAAGFAWRFLVSAPAPQIGKPGSRIAAAQTHRNEADKNVSVDLTSATRR